MKEFKGTPGPWVASITYRSIGPACRDDDQSYGMIFPVAWVEFDGDQACQQANARLIAAAPELLDALQRITPLYEALMRDCGIEHKELIAISQAAINKALGE